MENYLYRKTLKDLIIICLSTLILSLLIWLPHLFKLNFYGLNFNNGFNTIYRNFDGLNYVVIAKTLYNPELISNYPTLLPANYFAAHFPGYPLLMLLFAPLIGFLKSMLFVSLTFTIFSAIAFYFLVRDFKLSSSPLFLSLVFLILPARWLIVHSVGSPEPVFIFFVISALYFFMKFEVFQIKTHLFLAALFGLLAQITRPPGILLFIALGLYILWKIIKGKQLNIISRFLQSIYTYYSLLLIPVGLVMVFSWYYISYGDFFAYFNSGDNIHLTFPPYQVFNINQYWVGSIWLEDIIYIFILGFLGCIYLFKQKLYPLAFFVLTYLIASILVAHRDISRYTLPIFPFILIAFENILVSKEFRIVLAIVGLAIYLYAQNFLIANTAPIPNLGLFD